jgi:hypothetical protein
VAKSLKAFSGVWSVFYPGANRVSGLTGFLVTIAAVPDIFVPKNGLNEAG